MSFTGVPSGFEPASSPVVVTKKATSTTRTVCFNVGGKHHEVSTSMIESQVPDSMLCRLVSERWQEGKDPVEPIFIDRDGDRFACVLDYLRYGKLEVPLTISRCAVFLDLDYYSIEVDQAMISENFGSARLLHLSDQMVERDYILLAMECLRFFVDNGNGVYQRVFKIKENSAGTTFWAARKACNNSHNRYLLDKCLAAQGLKIERATYHPPSVEIALSKLEP